VRAGRLEVSENPGMRSNSSGQFKPLTRLMLAVLQYLAERRSRVLVRLYSNFWIEESDATSDSLFREVRDLGDRLQARGSTLAKDKQPLLVVRTPTVKAMAARGLLELTGSKLIVKGAAKRKDYARAELTAQATSICSTMEEDTRATYDEMLRRIR
jgi:hypothetical protein